MRGWLLSGLLVLVVAVSILAEASPYAGDGIFHLITEAVASSLAIMVGALALVRFRLRGREPWIERLAVTFIAVGVLDAYHTTVTGWMGYPELPWIVRDWTISQALLSLGFLWSALATSRHGERVPRVQDPDWRLWIQMMVALALLVPLESMLPASYFLLSTPLLGLARPLELGPGLLYVAAFWCFFRRRDRGEDPLRHGLLVALVLGSAAQFLFMARSLHMHDALFNGALVLKASGHAAVVVGLVAEFARLLRDADRNATSGNWARNALEAVAADRQSMEGQLHQISQSIETRVDHRTRELDQSRVAALNMMKDAEEARRRARASEEHSAMYARELKRSNEELGLFAYVASHDLQEPLRMVSSYTQLLAKRLEGQLDADSQLFIKYSVDGAKRMQELIQDLLEYSRVGTRGKPFCPVNCEEVLQYTLVSLSIAIEESEAVFTHDPLPVVQADESQIGQLFQNLIGNAIKFRGDAPPRIHMSAEARGEEWCFSLQDNGIGVEPSQQDRIFVVFQRLHERDTYPGSGIGLAICKKIVTRHGGKIWIDSEIGQGTTFHFTLPSNPREAPDYTELAGGIERSSETLNAVAEG